MRITNSFQIGPQTISYVEDDAILLCCGASLPIGGFVAAQFIVRDTTAKVTESIVVKWGLPIFAGGRFVLQPHTCCPWCMRELPSISITPARIAIN